MGTKPIHRVQDKDALYVDLGNGDRYNKDFIFLKFTPLRTRDYGFEKSKILLVVLEIFRKKKF